MDQITDFSVPNQTPEKKKGCSTPWLLGLGCTGFILLVCLCLFSLSIYNNYQSPSPQNIGGKPVLALAVNLQEASPRMHAFIGDANEDHWFLPPGNYYIEVLDDQNEVYLVGNKKIGKDGTWVDLSQLILNIEGEKKSSQSEEMILIANFLIGVGNGELTFLSHSSNGFEKPLFSSSQEWSPTDQAAIRESYSAILEREDETIKALSALESRAGEKTGLSNCPGSCKPASGILTSLTDFFRGAKDIDRRAVDDILQGSAAMSPQEKADAFEYFTPSMTGDSKSFDEMLEKLQKGELTDQANRIRSFLCDEETFYNALQQNRKTNRPLLNIANEEGALLVQKGAELEVDIIKSVLQNAFPGIEKGFDYADKVNKWAELIRKTYNDPLSGAASYASGEAGDEIKNQILNALLGLGIDETMADEMAGNLSVEILNQISSHDEELEELEKQETKQAETDSVEVDEDAEVIEEPTATKKPVSTITPTILTPTQESSIPQCDAMDYITVLSGHLTYEDVGDGCVYEAMVRNAHPQKNVYLAMHKVSGGIVTYKIDANKTWGTPFNMKAGNKNYSTDWFVAIFDTPECLDFYRGKSIDDFPSFGLNVVTTNYPTCGN